MARNVRRSNEIREMGDDYQRAEHALNVRRYDQAIEIMQRVLSNNPDNSVAFHTIARAYSLKKMPDKAIEAIRTSLSLDPTSSYAHGLYGSLLMDEKHYGQVEQEFNTAIALDPINHLAFYLYAIYWLDHKKNIVKAKEYCSKALEMDSADVRYHWMFGRIYATEGKTAEAEKIYLHALSMDPENSRVHNSYGVLLLNKKTDAKAAYEHFRTALMLAPEDEEARKNLQIAVKAKNPWYRPVWYYSLLRRRWGGAYAIFVVLFFLGAFWSIQNPATAVWVTLLDMLFLLFILYCAIIALLFNLLVKHGRLK